MLDDVVRYLTTRENIPPARMTGYDYILAGNGLFKRAMNRHVEVILPLSRVAVAGLPAVAPYFRMRAGRLDGGFLIVALHDARERSWSKPREAMYHVVMQEGQARLVRPRQQGSAGHLAYRGGGQASIICDLHSHHEMNAGFSTTDDRDELGFRFYAVMGRIFTRPELALRLGVYGDHWPVPITALFTHPGPFQEAEWWNFKRDIKWKSVTPKAYT